jgi:helicase
MRKSLRDWIIEAQTRQSAEDFALSSSLDELDFGHRRRMDLYIALVGEVFDLIRIPFREPRDCATIANALLIEARRLSGDAKNDANFYASVAFFMGGYSASAYLAMRSVNRDALGTPRAAACYDLMTRPLSLASRRVRQVAESIRSGDTRRLAALAESERTRADSAIHYGPEEWISRYLFANLLQRFAVTNVRAVLPNGDSPRWGPLVASFLDRRPGVWDFFPSQIRAIEAGLLSSTDTFSLQMPTGAGKTALMETLIFSHLTDRPGDLVILLVPFRALARELRTTLASRLSGVGFPTRTMYGGSVPTEEERTGVDGLSVLIATPESFLGLLSTQPELLVRVTLVVCDEGHLLDVDSRGIALELLLARLRQAPSSPRLVFMSAIIPNIEDLNTWLGGTAESVVRSTFRPSEIEYAVLRSSNSGANATVGLELAELDSALPVHTLDGFLEPKDFKYINPTTGRVNTHTYSSVKTRAVAAGRKALNLGAVAIFATTKTGNQGVVALSEELLKQLEVGLPLPKPSTHAKDLDVLKEVHDYFQREFGREWVGTRMLQNAAVMHHGDVPQEAREVLENLLVTGRAAMVVCTSTLAEGVNLPLRTIVLHSVSRSSVNGQVPMLARDIKNLVGRVGRPGSATRGLVICANPNQWQEVQPVAAGHSGEPVVGALIRIVRRLGYYLESSRTSITNNILEEEVDLFPLVDGLDQTLIELLSEEMGESVFKDSVTMLAASTFAAMQGTDEEKKLLLQIVRLRSDRMQEHRDSDRLAWFRESGANARLYDSVATELWPQLFDWSSFTAPNDSELLSAFCQWAFNRPECRAALAAAFRSDGDDHTVEVLALVTAWLRGETYEGMAEAAGVDMNLCLRVHAGVVLHTLVTLAEQGMAILERILSLQSEELAEPARRLGQYLLRGVHTSEAIDLMDAGVRHRRAATALAAEITRGAMAHAGDDIVSQARHHLGQSAKWLDNLGPLVLLQTRRDLGITDASI